MIVLNVLVIVACSISLYFQIQSGAKSSFLFKLFTAFAIAMNINALWRQP